MVTARSSDERCTSLGPSTPSSKGFVVGTSDVYLEGLRATGAGPDALVALIAHVIALLARFIGDDLTGKLIRQRWPDAPLGASGRQRRKEHV